MVSGAEIQAALLQRAAQHGSARKELLNAAAPPCASGGAVPAASPVVGGSGPGHPLKALLAHRCGAQRDRALLLLARAGSAHPISVPQSNSFFVTVLRSCNATCVSRVIPSASVQKRHRAPHHEKVGLLVLKTSDIKNIYQTDSAGETGRHIHFITRGGPGPRCFLRMY